MRYVNLYLTNRAYGGPEEGGWWYDCGEAVKTFPCATQRRAERIAALVQKIANCRNADGNNHDLNSVNCEGSYAVAIEAEPAQHYPSERPYYE